MGYILCTAEKPSVAGDIARVLGATKKCHGYYEGNGYRVTWAVGHLVGLAEPEAYGYMSLKDMWDKENPQNKEIALSELPLIPEEFKLVVIESTKDQIKILIELNGKEIFDEVLIKTSALDDKTKKFLMILLFSLIPRFIILICFGVNLKSLSLYLVFNAEFKGIYKFSSI